MSRTLAVRIHSIRGRIAMLVVIALVALGGVAWLGQSTLNHLKVNGPVYHDIVQDKDLLADVLPPPEYIIETYLVALEMLREPRRSGVEQLAERVKTLHADFDARHQVWVESLAEDDLKTMLVVRSHAPAVAFYEAVEGEFLPALLQGHRVRASQIMDQRMIPLYQEHRHAIDEVVRLATARAAAAEGAAKVSIERQTLTMLGFATAMLMMIAVVGWGLAGGIVTPIDHTIEVLEAVARGDLSRTSKRSRLAEVSRMGEALDRTVVHIREALAADRVDWQAVGQQRAEVNRIRQLVENAPINLTWADKDLKLVYINPAARNTFDRMGLPVDQLVGGPIARLHQALDREGARLRDPARLPFALRVEHADQTLDLVACAIRDEAGAYLGPMITWEVVTEQIQAAAHVETAQRRELKQAEERRQVERSAAEQQQAAAVAREAEQRARMEEERSRAAELQGKVDQILAVVDAAAAGDLTQAVEVRGADAIGRLGQGLAQFFSNLRGSVGNIARTAETVADATARVNGVGRRLGESAAESSAQASVVATAADEVSRNVQTVAAGTEEMSASIREIAKNAADAARIAGQAVKVADRTNHTVGKLGESSAEIGQVIKVITAIAQQTNLLALNATIEAARAGEAGKGFAVVANEVKELAKQTAQATEDISRKIEAIQVDTGDAVSAIREIGGIIVEISQIQTTIAGAVEEQTATANEMSRNISEAARGAEEIAQNIQRVAQAAQGASSGVDESQAAGAELVRAAEQLRSLVAQFRILKEEATRGRPERVAAAMV